MNDLCPFRKWTYAGASQYSPFAAPNRCLWKSSNACFTGRTKTPATSPAPSARLNENRMKTTVNTGKVSLPPAQKAAWGLKISDDEANVTERLRVLETVKWIAKAQMLGA